MSKWPCKECGARRGIHKKNCPTKIKMKEMPEVQDIQEEQVQPPMLKFYGRVCLQCGNQLMRVNCGRGEYCLHNRLVTDDCPECKKLHKGNLVWRCEKCGFVHEDKPRAASILGTMPRIDGEYVT